MGLFANGFVGAPLTPTHISVCYLTRAQDANNILELHWLEPLGECECLNWFHSKKVRSSLLHVTLRRSWTFECFFFGDTAFAFEWPAGQNARILINRLQLRFISRFAPTQSTSDRRTIDNDQNWTRFAGKVIFQFTWHCHSGSRLAAGTCYVHMISLILFLLHFHYENPFEFATNDGLIPIKWNAFKSIGLCVTARCWLRAYLFNINVLSR